MPQRRKQDPASKARSGQKAMAPTTRARACREAMEVSVSSTSVVKEVDCGLCAKVMLYLEDSEYYGVETDTNLTCHHGVHPVRRVAWEGSDTGRSFLAYPYEDEDECDFVMWVDGGMASQSAQDYRSAMVLCRPC
ncbi:uncharacterized protein LOC133914231 [Phragmites australis]|uniref:uncharacterized protein LOC133914231 n=1 Tax=Phragmites australis TaxID=29695 RepID=UPI002D77335E|nr:uncharacterized protein LOC133914231 [Phragmites australis]